MKFSKTILIPAIGIALLFAFLASSYTTSAKYAKIKTSDSQANKETKALYWNLKQMASKGVLFGHEDDLAYGVKWKSEKGRSDVKDVSGSYPAVFGWDVSKLGRYSFNIDTVDFEQMRGWILEAYKMGGVNTISWHLDNPVNNTHSWDTLGRPVQAILPGGAKHDWYLWKLDLFADFVNSLEVGFIFKHKVPIIFRPFHEHTGSWFWWGKNHCTVEEYKQLWHFTVDYLRNKKKINNLLYAYSPDIIESKEEYLERFPGNEYVDILGLDDYYDVGKGGKAKDLTRRLKMVVELAEEKGKVAALTETGAETIPNEKWWTDILLKHIKADTTTSKIAYVMVWRNAWPNHHYAPYTGHKSAPNFVEFRKDTFTYFEEDLPDLYRVE